MLFSFFNQFIVVEFKAYLSKGRGGFIICQYELQVSVDNTPVFVWLKTVKRIPGQPPLPVKDYMAIS